MIIQTLQRVTDELRSVLAELEPDLLSGPDAARVLEAFSEIEKLASGGRLLSARRVETSNIWRRKGHRSAAAHVAETTGTGLGPAIDALRTARQLGSLPATEEALRDGRLSQSQVKEIAGAASVEPSAEQELVETAEHQPMTLLKLRCRRVKAAGSDQKGRYEAIHRARSLRNWTDEDGAVRLDAKLTPDEGARLVAAIKTATDRFVSETRKAGVDEPRRALAADALVYLTCRPDRAASRRRGVGGHSTEGEKEAGSFTGGGEPRRPDGEPEPLPGPSAMVHVRVDHQALVRGRVRQGEICEIPGVGPIPVEVARQLAVDSILSVLVTDGVDVTAVAHAGRTIPAALRRALVERDPVCVVPGCEVGDGLEIDHVEPFGEGGATCLANLVRLCRWHHYLKTFQGHRLVREGPAWRWVARAGSGGRTPELLQSG